jgi:hypothetical protein
VAIKQGTSITQLKQSSLSLHIYHSYFKKKEKEKRKKKEMARICSFCRSAVFLKSDKKSSYVLYGNRNQAE